MKPSPQSTFGCGASLPVAGLVCGDRAIAGDRPYLFCSPCTQRWQAASCLKKHDACGGRGCGLCKFQGYTRMALSSVITAMQLCPTPPADPKRTGRIAQVLRDAQERCQHYVRINAGPYAGQCAWCGQ